MRSSSPAVDFRSSQPQNTSRRIRAAASHGGSVQRGAYSPSAGIRARSPSPASPSENLGRSSTRLKNTVVSHSSFKPPPRHLGFETLASSSSSKQPKSPPPSVDTDWERFLAIYEETEPIIQEMQRRRRESEVRLSHLQSEFLRLSSPQVPVVRCGFVAEAVSGSANGTDDSNAPVLETPMLDEIKFEEEKLNFWASPKIHDDELTSTVDSVADDREAPHFEALPLTPSKTKVFSNVEIPGLVFVSAPSVVEVAKGENFDPATPGFELPSPAVGFRLKSSPVESLFEGTRENLMDFVQCRVDMNLFDELLSFALYEHMVGCLSWEEVALRLLLYDDCENLNFKLMNNSNCGNSAHVCLCRAHLYSHLSDYVIWNGFKAELGCQVNFLCLVKMEVCGIAYECLTPPRMMDDDYAVRLELGYVYEFDRPILIFCEIPDSVFANDLVLSHEVESILLWYDFSRKKSCREFFYVCRCSAQCCEFFGTVPLIAYYFKSTSSIRNGIFNSAPECFEPPKSNHGVWNCEVESRLLLCDSFPSLSRNFTNACCGLSMTNMLPMSDYGEANICCEEYILNGALLLDGSMRLKIINHECAMLVSACFCCIDLLSINLIENSRLLAEVNFYFSRNIRLLEVSNVNGCVLGIEIGLRLLLYDFGLSSYLLATKKTFVGYLRLPDLLFTKFFLCRDCLESKCVAKLVVACHLSFRSEFSGHETAKHTGHHDSLRSGIELRRRAGSNSGVPCVAGRVKGFENKCITAGNFCVVNSELDSACFLGKSRLDQVPVLDYPCCSKFANCGPKICSKRFVRNLFLLIDESKVINRDFRKIDVLLVIIEISAPLHFCVTCCCLCRQIEIELKLLFYDSNCDDGSSSPCDLFPSWLCHSVECPEWFYTEKLLVVCPLCFTTYGSVFEELNITKWSDLCVPLKLCVNMEGLSTISSGFISVLVMKLSHQKLITRPVHVSLFDRLFGITKDRLADGCFYLKYCLRLLVTTLTCDDENWKYITCLGRHNCWKFRKRAHCMSNDLEELGLQKMFGFALDVLIIFPNKVFLVIEDSLKSGRMMEDHLGQLSEKVNCRSILVNAGQWPVKAGILAGKASLAT